MNARILIPVLAAATLFSLSAHAHDCSGGAGGGMDATGNQCNDAAAIATVVSSDNATFSHVAMTKVATNKVASCTKCAVKHTASTRHVAARQRNKHS